ncbi:IMP cyclohydrolase [Megasphaera coli]|uniref:IMP cyclohydrolase n=1 Tax=Colibacter massiliensis TaxID=1852379 RepID=UPI00094E6877|nr:IMP cyclohydrolase [Colibacter massiliensis]
MKIKRALLSVSDKTGITELGKELAALGVEIISTGGTMKTLQAAGIPVKAVQDVTGFPEMMDGRVKTLHPKIHGAILAMRDNKEHVRAMAEHGIVPVDLVVVNLYPFEATVAKPDVTLAEAVENIDIGGPCMVRAAAKNNKFVAVVTNPKKYGQIIDILKKDGEFSDSCRLELAREAFAHTAAYDAAVTAYLTEAAAKGASY